MTPVRFSASTCSSFVFCFLNLSLLARQPLQSFLLFFRNRQPRLIHIPMMFSTLALNFLVASVFATSAFSSPITGRSGIRSPVRRHHSYPSFDNYNSIGTMSNFDGFYGQNNFGGHNRHQTIIQQTPELVCQSVQVNIVQQRLAVISEMARRVVTEFSCEVETQVIAFEQFYQSMGYFSDDLRRHSGYQVGYDQNIISHFDDWYNSDGSLCTDDWGFQGSDIGSQTVIVSGDNWVDSSSSTSVESAYYAAVNAYLVPNSYSYSPS
ncbi:hypothetical protein HMN09_00420300 [Mycena chlorophos]|uniref:Uncharacterized protein n=1 Tax=Mycena chlorophos TaxID=658473 RepID=A0A8H6TDK2_MYCCL|nr:hypothetical protein HMN09_00420300 [Mycena chlorophos]